ncbi:MAG: response regulator transcription factor, partial [Dehalococcoidales bacterium]|nr:response regulator transcription factor [Dehalococcoidales bacterium]
KMRKIIALIIGNDPFSRTGLRELLLKLDNSSLLDVIECDPGENDRNAISVIAGSSPDVILIAMRYPHFNELEMTKKITRNFPGTKVVIVSANPHDDDDELFEVLKSGAAAYFRNRECTGTKFIETLERAANGEYPINDLISDHPNLSLRILRQFQAVSAMGKPMDEVAASLTVREVQVLTLVADGNSNKQIANILGTSEQTIKNHVSSILRKLNANDRAHAVCIAARDGIIHVDSQQPVSGSVHDQLLNEGGAKQPRRVALNARTLKALGRFSKSPETDTSRAEL